MNEPQRDVACDSVQDLLGAYALDAVDGDEAALLAAHLESCPRCAQEVAGHREAIAVLAAGGGPAPDGVWERIAASIAGEDRDVLARPAPRLPTIPRRRRRWTVAVPAAALAAAAAVAVLIGVQAARVDQLNHKVNQLSAAARQTGGFQGLAAALVDPSARHLTLTSTSPGSRPVGQLVILPSGAAYLVGSRLPALGTGQTYQLWSMVAGRSISVGLLGDRPTTVAFSIDPSVPTSAYLVTIEPAGGVVAPTGAPVAGATV